MRARKSWNEKLLDNKGLPKVGRVEGKMTKRWGTGTMVIPAPIEVKELMDRVPKGKLVTINGLRTALSKKHDTSIACPITTGIFAWIVAHAAHIIQTQCAGWAEPWRWIPPSWPRCWPPAWRCGRARRQNLRNCLQY